MEDLLVNYIDIIRYRNGNLTVRFSRSKEGKIYKKLSELGVRRIKDNKYYNNFSKDAPIKYFNLTDLKLFLSNYLLLLKIGIPTNIDEEEKILNFIKNGHLIKRNALMREHLK